jgi:hypothetical protein
MSRSHELHGDAPVTVLYFPAAHALQVTPLDIPVYPALQKQSNIDMVSVSEVFVPGGQDKHSIARPCGSL